MCCPMVRCAVAPSAAGAACNNTNNRAWSTSVCSSRIQRTLIALAQHRERLLLPPCLGASNEYGYSSRTSYTPPPNHT